MPKIAHVLEASIYGRDLAAMERFYAGLLGMEKMSEEYPRHVFFKFSGDCVLLVFNPEETAKKTEIPSHGGSGSGHVAFAVEHDDMTEWRDVLSSGGVAIEQEITWPNGACSIYFRDPAGNSVELVTRELWSA